MFCGALGPGVAHLTHTQTRKHTTAHLTAQKAEKEQAIQAAQQRWQEVLAVLHAPPAMTVAMPPGSTGTSSPGPGSARRVSARPLSAVLPRCVERV